MKPLTSAQMRRIDRIAVQQLKIPVLLLMDNAGRSVAEAVHDLAGRRPNKKITVLCGGGHNGGDGVAAARYLKGWGHRVNVFWLKNPAEWEGDVAAHYQMAKRGGVPFFAWTKVPPAKRVSLLKQADILVDALLGTGFSGHLRIPMFDAIAAMNASKKPIVAVDLPSGLDPDTGVVRDIAVKARLTVTLAAPKPGFFKPKARPYVGRLTVADIGIPHVLLKS